MRVPDEFLSTVFFLGVEGVSERHYAATGFYFEVDNEFDPGSHRVYFVTAKHNIEGARKEPGALFVRVNTEDGGSVHAEISKEDWTFHRDSTVDVAVLSVSFADKGDRRLQSTRLHAGACVDDALIKQFDIGVGTEISVVGLFTPREGKERNLPIIRSGIIAAMPGEPIEDGTGHGAYRAYLADLVSIGGLSGSPTFVHPTPGPHHTHPRHALGGGQVRVSTEWHQPSFVLGLVRSHWDELPPFAPETLPRREWLNRGISAVTPIGGVLDVLQYDVFVDERRSDADQAASG